MRRLITNSITIIIEIAVIIIAFLWFQETKDYEPIIVMTIALGGVVTAVFFKMKEPESNKNTIINDISPIQTQTIIQEVSEGGMVIINQIDLNKIINQYTEEEKQRVKLLEKALEDKGKLSDLEKQKLYEDIIKLKNQIREKEDQITEVIKSHEKKSEESRSSLYQKAFQLFINGESIEALNVLNEEEIEKDEKKTADARILKAQLLELAFDFKQAEENYLKAITFHSSFENNLTAADFYCRQNKFEESGALYKKCFEKVKTIEEKAIVFVKKGYLQFKMNELEDAKLSYREGAKIYRILAKSNPHKHLPDVAKTVNDIGVMQYNINELEDAVLSYKEAMEIYRILAKSNPQEYLLYIALTFNNIGGVQSRMKESENAMLSYKEAERIFRELAESNPQKYLPNVANILDNIGILQSETNRLDDAKLSFQEIIEIYRNLNEFNPQTYLREIAIALNNLGNLQSEMNELEDAELSYQEALSTLTPNEHDPMEYLFNPDILIILKNLGKLQDKMNKL